MAGAMGYSLSPCGLIVCDRSTDVVSTFISHTEAGIERPGKALL